MLHVISGRIESTEPLDQNADLLGGCRVDVFFEHDESPKRKALWLRKDDTEDSDSSIPLTAKGIVSARTDSKGGFTLDFPEDIKILSEALRFTVSGPAGQLIAEFSSPLREITENLAIPVSFKGLIGIVTDTPKPPASPATRRIKGRVIDRAGHAVAAGLQVLVFVSKSTDPQPAETMSPVLAARTDASGYFFGEVPSDKCARAVALVSGIKAEVAITLENGLVPIKLVVVIDLPLELVPEGKKDGCSCSVVPRTPTQADIENSPGTFSADLGTGACVQFNTPNRAIEEFNFYTVVRTTEPAILSSADGKTAGTSSADLVLASLAKATAAALQAADAAKAEKAAIDALSSDGDAQQLVADLQRTQVRFGNPHDLHTAVQNWKTDPKLGHLVDLLRNDLGEDRAKKVAGMVAEGIHSYSQQLLATATADQFDEIVHVIVASLLYNAVKAAEATSASAAGTRNAAVAAAQLKLAEAKTAFDAAQAAEEARRALIASREQSQAKKIFKRPVGRVELNARNRVDWDDTPTFYQAAEVAHGHLLHFKQVWYADGYSLGDLLYSLPLAPGQKRLISVLDWDRRERTERSEDNSSSEALDASLIHDRDLGEVVKGALSESSRGGSKSTSEGVAAGFGAAANGSYLGVNFGALLGVSGGYGEANSSAWQESGRNIASDSLQSLRERILQSASAVRSFRSSVVHTVSQGESLRATTEVVANHNHCHAITVQYFEVLRHLKLEHELAGVQECLFVPLPMTEFDLEKTLRWRQELRTYLQRPQLVGGFDAARRIDTNWSQVDAPKARYADEFVISLSGELLMTVLVPLPPFPERPKPKPEDSAAEAALALADAVNPTTGFLGVLLAIATGGVSLIAGSVTAGVIKATQSAAKGARAVADELHGKTDPQERYKKFHREIVPGVVEGFIDQLELYARVGSNEMPLAGVDFTLVSEYQPGIPLAVSLRATLPGTIKRSDVSQLIIKSRNGLPQSFRAIVKSATIRYRTKSFEHAFVDDQRVNDDIDTPKAVAVFQGIDPDYEIQTIRPGAGAALFTPIDEWEQRSPRAEDQRLATELIEHLNDNFEYYHHAIWWTMDPNRRYMLLDGYFAPNSNGRSVASVVENRLIGIVGNSLVLPVAHGVRLDPRANLRREDGSPVSLLDLYKMDSPVPAARVSLPTRGVFAEAVMGSCNSCEKIDDSRFWRWEESPIDEPPSIDPLSTATRRSEPPSGQPTPFPAPIVSIQNAPNVPDPAGVRVVLDALGKQSFADITGLAGTQANAAAAYSQALSTALQFGKEASVLAQQAASLKNKDKILGAIDSAEQDGKIDEEQAKKSRGNYFDTLSPPPIVTAPDPNEWEQPTHPESPGRKLGEDDDPKPLPKPGKKQSSKIIPVSLKLRVFVPSPIWEPALNSLIGIDPVTSQVALVAKAVRFNGDGRDFSFDNGSSRVEITYNLNVIADAETEKLKGIEVAPKPPEYGWAKVYDAGGTTDVGNGKPEWWESLDAGARMWLNKRMKHDEDKVNVSHTDLGQSIEVTFVLKAQPYFPWGAADLPSGADAEISAGPITATLRNVVDFLADVGLPDIDALIKVHITKRAGGLLEYTVSGEHDMFPAYELYVNGEEAYKWGTETDLGADDAPSGLSTPKPIEDDRIRVVKTKR